MSRTGFLIVIGFGLAGGLLAALIDRLSNQREALVAIAVPAVFIFVGVLVAIRVSRSSGDCQ